MSCCLAQMASGHMNFIGEQSHLIGYACSLAVLRRTSIAAAPRRLIRPTPSLNFRHVFAMKIDVVLVLGQLVAEMLRRVRGFGGETRHAFNHIHCQMEAIELVEHHYVEWFGVRPFLDESPHVHV